MMMRPGEIWGSGQGEDGKPWDRFWSYEMADERDGRRMAGDGGG